VLFQALKINVQPVLFDPASAIQQLRQGEIAAIVHVAKSPARLFFNMNWDDRVHFLAIPFTQEISRIYLPAVLAPADYPMLIRGGEAGRGTPIATVAVPIVLAVNSRTMRDEGKSRTLAADWRCAAAQCNSAAEQFGISARSGHGCSGVASLCAD